MRLIAAKRGTAPPYLGRDCPTRASTHAHTLPPSQPTSQPQTPASFADGRQPPENATERAYLRKKATDQEEEAKQTAATAAPADRYPEVYALTSTSTSPLPKFRSTTNQNAAQIITAATATTLTKMPKRIAHSRGKTRMVGGLVRRMDGLSGFLHYSYHLLLHAHAHAHTTYTLIQLKNA